MVPSNPQKDNLTAADPMAQAVETLFAFAIDREDVKWSLERLPAASPALQNTVAYELQALKIITVGWSITFLLADSPNKHSLQQAYWQAVQQFAGSLSSNAGLLIGHEIDYFGVLKQRLEIYLAAIRDSPQAGDPSQIVGPAFAGACGVPQDLPVAMAGARMFKNTLERVHAYLTDLKNC